MLFLLFVAAASGAAESPLLARLVSVTLQKPNVSATPWYNKVDIELVSLDERVMSLCPDDVSVATARRVSSGYTPVSRYTAHAMRAGSGYTGSCRQLILAPNVPQKVSFYVSGVPGRWRGEDRYSIMFEAGGASFELVEQRQ